MKDLVITIDDNITNINDINEIAENLRKMNCQIKNIFPFGVISLSVEDDVLMDSLKIKGVNRVEIDHPMFIEPNF